MIEQGAMVLYKRAVCLTVCLVCFVATHSHGYLLKQGLYLFYYQCKAKRIERLLKKDDLPDDDRAFFSLVKDIREFAHNELGLKSTRNYTSYVTTDKDHLVTVVCAARPDTLALHQWWFPFFGKFPYLGYYQSKDAQKKIQRLRKKGFEVFSAEVDAFSTLGILKDPLYSYMKNYSEYSLANLIIHELTHATIFLKNQVHFNEELAVFVAREGALFYIKQKYGEHSGQYRSALTRIAENKQFDALMQTLYNELKDCFSSNLSTEEKIKMKNEIIRQHKTRFIDDYHKLFVTNRYKGFGSLEWNNAFVMYFMTYTQDLTPFYQLLEKNDHGIKATLNQLKQVKNSKGDPKQYIVESLLK